MITHSLKKGQAPRVTVLMSVYNCERYLREAIESILAQTFAGFEFLIVNDGSRDKSREIILSYKDSRIRLVDNADNMGLAKSLNMGLAMAQGNFIARQDADDISSCKRLELQARYLENNPEVALVGTQAKFIDHTGKTLFTPGWRRCQTDIGIRWQILFESPFVHSSVMFRRDIVWDVLHGYNENFRISQDYELWSRIVYRYKVSNLPEKLVSNRQHDSITSKQKDNIDLLQKVEKVMLENTKRTVRLKEVSENWPKAWVNITHKKIIYKDVRLEIAYDFLNEFYLRYISMYGSDIHIAEVKRHYSNKAALIVNRLAASEPKKALVIYSRLASLELVPALINAPKFLFFLLCGILRVRGTQNAVNIVRSFFKRCYSR